MAQPAEELYPCLREAIYALKRMLEPPGRHEAPEGEVIFARVRAFDITCPHCTTVTAVTTRRRPDSGYDVKTGRWQCPGSGCKHRYQVGLLLWPLDHGARVHLPKDQKLTQRIAAQLRAQYAGLWAKQTLASGEAATRVVKGDTNATTNDD